MVQLSDFDESLIETPISKMSLSELEAEYVVSTRVQSELNSLLLDLNIRRSVIAGQITRLRFESLKIRGK